jgi:DNA polymerase III subunit delta'
MFDKLIGNNQIKKILSRLVKERRVPNSLLFAGEEGVGKRLFALELAKAFVCRNPSEGEACDRCAACRRADSFVFPKPDDRDAHKKVIFSEHPDIGTIIPFNRNILVDAVRELEKEANFRPFEAGARFFLIDAADKLNAESANALLKTLEEPPAASYIFLITSRPLRLLPTILSRCQTLRFAPIAAQEIEKHLVSTKQFAPEDARLLAKLSHGKLGFALDLDLEKFRSQRAAMVRVLESLIIKKDRAALLKTAEEITDAKNKDEYENHLKILQNLIHDIWTIRLGAGNENVFNSDLSNQLNKLAERADSRNLSAWLSEIETLREQFAVNINRKIATDALFMQMAG